MVKRMLIDATHAEETRVVVLSGTRLEEFDVETSTKRQLKGNIYLAKVVRVEPSLQAAFVDYGGNRHGFLSFNEIHPDYYQIPIEDRRALLADREEMSRRSAAVSADFGDDEAESEGDDEEEAAEAAPEAEGAGEEGAAEDADEGDHRLGEEEQPLSSAEGDVAVGDSDTHADLQPPEESGGPLPARASNQRRIGRQRHYKIQEVIKRRQIVLIQVVKEERGNKGAAVTTYLSLAGRYCVLMPNTARGGGVSRKITSAADRRRLKTITNDLDIPDGMAVIVRTAGSERTKPEIKRDYEYLLRMWDNVRELTLKSTAPALIYEEGNLIKRSIRDLYSRDIDEILVDGEEGYRLAKDFMRMLTPSHAKKVKLFADPSMPLFHRFQVESQLDAMHSPTVQLKSGGYIVFGQTEALVAIDVNSGRSTRERHIEETALKTNLEAADEIARQLRLRDLAGLIVIDFIDMEESRNNHAVERRLKEALRFDRARIQVGKISTFGLLEMSRQRLRPSLLESSFLPCVHCGGTGMVRSVESSAVHILRLIEEEASRHRTSEATVTVHSQVALYLLNQKRAALADIEARTGLHVLVSADDALIPPAHRLERAKTEAAAPEARRPIHFAAPPEEEESGEAGEESEAAAPARREAAPHEGGRIPTAHGEEGEGTGRSSRRRRRGRRGGRREEGPTALSTESQGEAEEASGGSEASSGEEAAPTGGEAQSRRRRRGRRGGRRHHRREEIPSAAEGSPTVIEGGAIEAGVASPAIPAQQEAPFSGEPLSLEAVTTEAAEAPVAREEESAPTAKRRRSRREPGAEPKPRASRRKAEPALLGEAMPETGPEAAMEPAAPPAEVVEAPIEAESPLPISQAPAVAQPLPEPPPLPVEPPQESVAPAEEEPPPEPGPRRRGWWNRLI